MCLVEKLLTEIESCGYECQAGALQSNMAWQDLRRIVTAQQHEICSLTETIETNQQLMATKLDEINEKIGNWASAELSAELEVGEIQFPESDRIEEKLDRILALLET